MLQLLNTLKSLVIREFYAILGVLKCPLTPPILYKQNTMI